MHLTHHEHHVSMSKKTNIGGGENQKGRKEKRIEADGDVDMTGGDSTETSTDRERKGDWTHLFGPESCGVCWQNPFECGCLNVCLENKGEKGRREAWEKARATWNTMGLADGVNSVKGRWEFDGRMDLRLGAVGI